MDIHSFSRLYTSISWQQSRLSWLKDGDANSKYFHAVLAARRRGNSINFLHVDGLIVEGVIPVREAVFNYFSNHFLPVEVVWKG